MNQPENNVIKRLAILLNAFLFLFCVWPLYLSADTQDTTHFTPAQQTEIQNIIHDYLLDHPEILIQVAQKLQEQQNTQIQQQAAAAVSDNVQSLFFSPDSPVAGNDKGNVTLIEFFDYQCPHCKQMEPILQQLLKTDPQLRVVFKEFPIFGQSSMLASRVALAAREQGKYQQMHAALMKARGPFSEKQIFDLAKNAGLDMATLKIAIDNANIQQEIKNNIKLASLLGLPGTPGFIIAPTPQANASPNKDKIFVLPGQTDLATLQKTIAQARKTN